MERIGITREQYNKEMDALRNQVLGVIEKRKVRVIDPRIRIEKALLLMMTGGGRGVKGIGRGYKNGQVQIHAARDNQGIIQGTLSRYGRTLEGRTQVV